MNILFVTYSFYPIVGGVEYQVKKLAEEFKKLGHKIIVLTSKEVIITSDTKYYFKKNTETFSDFTVKRFRFKFPRFTYSKKTIHKLIFNIYLLAFYLRLFLILIKYKIDIVHAHLLNVDSYFLIRAKKYLHFPLILTCHGGEIPNWRYKKPQRFNLAKEILNKVDCITTVSSEIKNQVSAVNSHLEGKLRIIPNGINCGWVNSIKPVAADCPFILFVGRLFPEKGVDVLINAFAHFLRNKRNYKLIIIGDGEDREALEHLALTLTLDKDIIFLSDQPHLKVLSYMKSASCLAIPSYNEGCPSVLLEGMAAHVPIIASNIPSIQEIVKHNDSALLFEVGNSRSLAEQLNIIFSNQQISEKIKLNAWDIASNTFDQNKINNLYLSLYKKIASDHI